ncbi:hypothetical protein Tco_0321292 [Tanacetum coccineum]
MDNDLFTYEIEITNIPCNSKMDDDSENEADDDMGGDDEVELTDEDSSDNEDEIAEVFRIDTNIFDYKTPLCSAFNEFNYLLRDGGYCNGANLPGTYTIENQLHYQDIEWYEALEDSELKDLALRNKAIMEGFIKEDNDESHYEQKRRWYVYTNYDDAKEINHEREELCQVYEPPVCNIRKYRMIKYLFNNDEEFVAVKEDKYDDLTITRKEACLAYQEIFRIIDEGWMVTRANER